MSRRIEALAAALRRVGAPLNEIELQIEAAWLSHTVPSDKNGRIMWRTFRLGQELFRRLAEAQNWRCCYCGGNVREKRSGSHDDGTFEHVIPLGKNGTDHPDNMVVACSWCNTRYSNF